MSRASQVPQSDGQSFWGDNPEVSINAVRLSGLYPVGRRPLLVAYVRQLWRRRHFTWADTRAKALGSQRGTFLGNAQLIVRPMLDAIAYFLVLDLLLQTSCGIDNFTSYLIIGIALFPPLQRVVTGGNQVIITDRNLIRGFSFPRAASSASHTIRSVIDLVSSVIALPVLMAILPPHAWPSWYWILVISVLAPQVLLSLRLAPTTSRVTTTTPDMCNIWPFLTRFWFYALEVFFSYGRSTNHPVMLRIMDLDPNYLIIMMYWDATLYWHVPQPRMWLILSAQSLGLTVVSFVFFWEKEEAYGVEY